MFLDPNNYQTVFLSYDEPNCEKNFENLLLVCPKAKRVHGIKGSDAAHKKVAALFPSDSHVIIVDGDNFVRDDFYKQKYLVNNYNDKVVSFTAHNIINGQQYGNGGIKCWPLKIIRTMKTHENSNDLSTLVDFDLSNYIQLNHIASDIIINSSPLQAWRAGFREGVKLLLENGKLISDLNSLDWRNFDRLYNWMHIGADVENGLFAIYGARLGVYKSLINFDLKNLHDFDYLNSLFHMKNYSTNLLELCNELGNKINILLDKDIVDDVYSVNESFNYKHQVKPILRCPDDIPYDIVFIDYDETFADENYKHLTKRFPRALRIQKVKGIHNAHIKAAMLCKTDYFYVVDGDAEILDSFNFDYKVPFYDQPKIRVWRAKNCINDLEYGYGAVKLLPRTITARLKKTDPDMSTSLGIIYERVNELSNITKFNTNSFNTWRSAFRECSKLASEQINNQNTLDTAERLHVWCTKGLDKPFGKYCIDGALYGRSYGLANKNNKEKLMLINDYDWLKEQYDRFYENPI